MKFEDLKGKTRDELNQLVLEGKKELFNLRFQRTTGELEKTNRFKEIRKNIARINTYINSGVEITAATSVKKEKPAKKEKAAKAEKEPKAKKETKKKKVA
jgi:large subunit ribosomal protein L29